MATAQNKVSVDLEIGSDSLTPALNRIRGLADDLRGSFGGFRNSFIGGAAFGVAQAAIDGVTSSIRNMTGAIKEATDLETSSIIGASDIATGLNIGLDPALKLVNDTQIQLGKIATAVGSEAQDFTAIFRQISSAISSLSSSPLDFQAKATEISKRAGILSSASGANPEQTGSVLDRFISGTSTFSELALNNIFQKNSLLTNEIKRLMKERGFEPSQLKQMTAEARLDILDRALRVATPDSLIQKLKGTAGSVIKGIWDNLFNPTTGVFGFSRQIESMGNRTALNGLAGMLQSLFSLGTTIGNKLQFDPMKGLLKLFDWVADVSNYVNLLATGSIDFNLADISDNIGTFLGNILDRVYSFVDSIPAEKIGIAIGGLVYALLEALAGLIPKLVALSLKILEKLVFGILSAVLVAPLKLIADQVTKGLRQAVDPIIKPISDFFNGVKRLFDQVMGMIPKLPSVGNPAEGLMEGAKSLANQAAKVFIPGYGLIEPFLPKPVQPQATPPTFPPGTTPLPQPQATPPSPPTGQPVSFNPVLNFNGLNGDPEANARAMMAVLNREYKTFQQGSLA